MKKTLIVLLLLLVSSFMIFAESIFDMDIEVDYQKNVEGDETITTLGIALSPDLAFGNWGLGLYLPLRFELNGEKAFSFYSEDWVPEFVEGSNWWDKTKVVMGKYFPLFRYIRYGEKDQDIYVKLGYMDDVEIGTGIFVNHYSNTALGTNRKQFGLEIDLDGKLFNFPYVGLEAFTNNLATLQIIGGRLYARPFAWVNAVIIKDIEVGGSYFIDRDYDAMDRYGYTRDEFELYNTPTDDVYMMGADLIIPLAQFDLFNFDLYGDYAMIGNKLDSGLATAFRAGFKGDAIGFLNYQADITLPNTEGFVPEYFSKNYDVDPSVPFNKGMNQGEYFLHAKGGFSLLGDKLALDLHIKSVIDVENNFAFENPSMTADITIGEGLIPGFACSAIYTKNNIDGSNFTSFLQSIGSPTRDSVIEAQLTIKYSILKVSTGYTIEFDQDGNMYSSGLNLGGALALF